MSKYYSILFEESLPHNFPGFSETDQVHDFPIWGNFTIRNVLELSNTSSIPFTLFSVKMVSDLEPLNDFLSRSVAADSIIIGRTGNIAVLDWKIFYHIRKVTNGIGKVHLGKAPSELYIVQRKKLKGILAHVGERLEKGERVELETVRRRKDGRTIQVLCRVSPIFTQGKRTGGFAFYSDISK